MFWVAKCIWIHYANNLDDLNKIKITNKKPHMLPFKVVKKVIKFKSQLIVFLK